MVFVRLSFQTRYGGAEHVKKWKSFFDRYLQMRFPNSIRTDPIILKIC